MIYVTNEVCFARHARTLGFKVHYNVVKLHQSDSGVSD